MLPAPFDVLESTLGPAARVVALDGTEAAGNDLGTPPAGPVRVVRTVGRADHPPGNAVHHLTPVPPAAFGAAVADLEQRFPVGRARLVTPHGPELAVAAPAGLHPSLLTVLRRVDEPAPDADRGDIEVAAPRDDRDWHGITVLHRHVDRPGEDRARGSHDDRLRWWVAGLRELVGSGRARVLRAVRFGTPVAVGVLHWAPGVEVDEGHAGLAVVAGVVVHPAHRGLGVGRTLVDQLVATHLADFPSACVTALVEREPETDARIPSRWEHMASLSAWTRAVDPARP